MAVSNSGCLSCGYVLCTNATYEIEAKDATNGLQYKERLPMAFIMFTQVTQYQ